MNFKFISSGNRPSALVEEQPSTVLSRWAVVQVSSGARLLVGERADVLTWRRSTPIVDFLPTQRMMVTTSGRRYFLQGPPVSGEVELDLIRTKLEIHGIRGATDVTETYWCEMLRAAH